MKDLRNININEVAIEVKHQVWNVRITWDYKWMREY